MRRRKDLLSDGFPLSIEYNKRTLIVVVMPTNVPHKRMWLPLYIISKQKKFALKTKLQKVVFLAQLEAKQDAYDFRRYFYGPYSRDLDVDIVSHPELIREEVCSTLDGWRAYYVFQITPDGREAMERLERLYDKKAVAAMKFRVDGLVGEPLDRIMEGVYSEYVDDPDSKVAAAEGDLETFSGSLQNISNSAPTRQLLFMLAAMDSARELLEGAKSSGDPLQKSVVAKMAEELVEKAKEALPCAFPVADSAKLRPAFVTMADAWEFMLKYCGQRGIVKNPFEAPLEEVLTEDDARRLQKAFSELELEQ